MASRGARRSRWAATVTLLGGSAFALLASPRPSSAQERTPPIEGPAFQVSASIRSEAGELVQGATVRLVPLSDDGPHVPLSAPSSEQPETETGRYVGQGVRPGSYELVVAALGYQAHRQAIEVVDSDVSLTVTLAVRPVAVMDLLAIGAADAPVPGHATSRIALDGGARTLAERLAEEPGVQVRPSRSGGQVGSVRGSRPEGLLVLLDGLPINDPIGGAADLSRIPVATLAEATLVRGASPRFGSGAIAGVLLLESKRPQGTSAAAGFEVGSFGRVAADGYAAVGGRAGTLAVGFRAEGIDNDFEFLNRTVPGSPTETRENADTDGIHLWLSGGPAALPIFAQVRYDDVERGAPGRMGTHAFDEARYADRSLQGLFGYGSSSGRATVALARRDFVYSDPRHAVETAQSLTSVRVAGSTRVPGVDLEVSSYLARESVVGEEETGRPVRWSGGLWLGRTFSTGRFSIQPGVATDVTSDGGAVNPEVALAAQLGSLWTLWGRAGSAYRLPTFADLYAPSARGIQANPDLMPERVVVDAEAGVSWTSNRVRDAGARDAVDLQMVAFFRRTDDPIVWIASAVALWSPQNLDRLTSAGAELRVDAPLGTADLRVGGSFTVQRSRLGFGSNKNPMPYQPDLAGDVHVGGAVAGIWLRAAARILGSRTTTLAGTRRLPPHAVLRLDGSRGFPIGAMVLDVSLAIDNLLNARYEVTELFPEPGRSLVLRVGVRR